jgi:hypothetical protein
VQEWCVGGYAHRGTASYVGVERYLECGHAMGTV